MLSGDTVPPVRGAFVTFSRHPAYRENIWGEGYDPCGESMEAVTLRHIEARRGFAGLRPMDNSPFLASFSALTVLYAAAWIVLLN